MKSEWGEFLGEGGDFLWEDWFLWGGDEKFGGGEGFVDNEEFGCEVFSFGGVIGGGLVTYKTREHWSACFYLFIFFRFYIRSYYYTGRTLLFFKDFT